MAFGQSSGPPATGKQLNELLELLEAAGHSDFRDARGPMGFTQRQAGGKFSRDEADEFIEQLQSELYGDGPPGDSRPPDSTRAAAPPPKIAPRKQRSTSAKRSAAAGDSATKSTGSWRDAVPSKAGSSKAGSAKKAPAKKKPAAAPAAGSAGSLEDFATEDLAAELQRRGWVVLEP